MKSLKLVFVTDQSKKITISLDNPKDDVTAAEIKTVMDTIIAKDIFATKSGKLVSKDSSYIEETAKSEIALA